MRDPDRVREDMRRLLRAVEELRKLDPRMELGQLAVLLTIMTDPGIWGTEVRKKTGLASASLTRNVQGLSSIGRDGKPGLGLIAQYDDVMDTRAKQLSTTIKGRQLAEKLSEILKG